jgi:hypothetical protein
MTSMRGPGIFLAQFARNEPPLDTFEGLCGWAADLGYEGVQVPAWQSAGDIDLDTAVQSACIATTGG